MAIRDIRTYGDACLRGRAKHVAGFDEATARLARDLAETMYATRGVGLAAPQVGAAVRVFVSDTEWVRQEEGEPAKRDLKIFLNPEILWESAEDSPLKEGCLSVPGVEAEVYRADSIRLRWLDEEGRVREQVFEGLAARCAQHEIDHLDGVLFVDRLPLGKRRGLAGKLNALRQSPAGSAAASAK